MGDLLNVVFEELLTAAYDFGASLLKWGGDAVLLHYDGDGPRRARRRRRVDMQASMRRIGRLPPRAARSGSACRSACTPGRSTSCSSAVTTANCRHRTGGDGRPRRWRRSPQRGQIVISPQTAAPLPARCIGAARGGGFLLATAPAVLETPNRTPKRSGVDLGQAVSAHVREHLRSGRSSTSTASSRSASSSSPARTSCSPSRARTRSLRPSPTSSTRYRRRHTRTR